MLGWLITDGDVTAGAAPASALAAVTAASSVFAAFDAAASSCGLCCSNALVSLSRAPLPDSTSWIVPPPPPSELPSPAAAVLRRFIIIMLML